MTSLLIVYINLVCFLFIPPGVLALDAGNFPYLFFWIKLITCQFGHVGFMHFCGNFFYAIPFLAYAEFKLKLSSKEIWKIWLLGGVVGGILQSLAVGGGLVGASMSICAMQAYCTVRARDRSFLSAAMWAVALSGFYLDVSSVLGASHDNVGHWGHIGGWICGAYLAISCGMRHRRSTPAVAPATSEAPNTNLQD